MTIVEFLTARLDEAGRGVKDCPGDPYCPCPLAHDDAAEADIAAKRRLLSPNRRTAATATTPATSGPTGNGPSASSPRSMPTTPTMTSPGSRST